MKIKPLHDHVVVKPIQEEQTSSSGIVLPETMDKERPEKGEVVAIGPGRMNDKGERTPMSVQRGDVVMFKKYSPEEIEIDKEDYLVIKDSDILAVFEGSAPSVEAPSGQNEVPNKGAEEDTL
jgi:chaperonin GroES